MNYFDLSFFGEAFTLTLAKLTLGRTASINDCSHLLTCLEEENLT